VKSGKRQFTCSLTHSLTHSLSLMNRGGRIVRHHFEECFIHPRVELVVELRQQDQGVDTLQRLQKIEAQRVRRIIGIAQRGELVNKQTEYALRTGRENRRNEFPCRGMRRDTWTYPKGVIVVRSVGSVDSDYVRQGARHQKSHVVVFVVEPIFLNEGSGDVVQTHFFPSWGLAHLFQELVEFLESSMEGNCQRVKHN
jgi:hypothetical protein